MYNHKSVLEEILGNVPLMLTVIGVTIFILCFVIIMSIDKVEQCESRGWETRRSRGESRHGAPPCVDKDGNGRWY